jgi:hypothetical protein
MLSSMLPLIVVVVGAILTYWLSRSAETRKQLALIRAQCYADYLRALAKAAHAKSAVDGAAAISDAADAKTRIAVYGTEPVIHALANFERAGPVLDNAASIDAFIELAQSMRQARATTDDLKQILFSRSPIQTSQPPSSPVRKAGA